MVLIAAWPHLSHVGMLLAGMLVAAVIAIRITRISHVPRVVGYLVLGIAARFALQWTFGGAEAFGDMLGNAVSAAEVVKSLALCLILFAIGAEFDATHIKSLAGHLWKLTLVEALTVGIGVFVATWAVGLGHSPIQAVFLAAAALATAPAATLHVLRQYQAKGAITDHIIAMTGLNNLVAIVSFRAAFLLLAGTNAIHVDALEHPLGVAILLATVGSASVGFVGGLCLSLAHIMLTRFESVLLLLAAMLAISIAAAPLGMNALILCMFMGVAFTNFSIQPHRLRDDLNPLAAPILVLFFVLSGFELELHKLWEVGAIGVAFIVMRTIGKLAGGAVGVRWIGRQHRVTPRIGSALLCQAGVAIGLGEYLMDHWGRTVDGRFVPDPGAEMVNTVILASVAVFELIGPLATKRMVVRAGEVKAMTLLARPGGSVREMSTIIARLGRALVPGKFRDTEATTEPFTTRHAMRTNVESLRDTAKMTEVLRFVEHSRLSHFFVVDADGHFVGTINFRDLRNLMFNPMMARMLTAYDMANTAPPIALADQPLKEILDLFHEHDDASLPVIENRESRRLLGVIEQRDVLRALHVGPSGEHEES